MICDHGPSPAPAAPSGPHDHPQLLLMIVLLPAAAPHPCHHPHQQLFISRIILGILLYHVSSASASANDNAPVAALTTCPGEIPLECCFCFLLMTLHFLMISTLNLNICPILYDI
jgi:hypothetical protein